MFEREIIDGQFVKRWGIVRLLREQSISEHSHLVTIYANDVATYLNLPLNIRLSVALYAPWHDLCDEIFTGDLPGPNKRALLTAEARTRWDEITDTWAKRTFPNIMQRAGRDLLADDKARKIVKLVVKVADWLEAATAMATETQMGNGCTKRHIVPNMLGAIETAHELCNLLHIGRDYGSEVPLTKSAADSIRDGLIRAIEGAVDAALNSQSAGPWIAREDADREGRHDPELTRV